MMLFCQFSDIFFRPSCSFLDEIYSNMHLQEVHDDLVAILHSSFCKSTLFCSFIDSYTQLSHVSHQPFFIII